MTKVNKILLGILIVTVIAILFQQFTSQKSERPNKRIENNKLTSQENEGGNVTVTVEPDVLEIGRKPRFKFEFNTHSVDLAFDVSKASVLQDNLGNIYENGLWEGSPPEGHHRQGTLTFDKPLEKSQSVDLMIRNVAGIPERKLTWKL